MKKEQMFVRHKTDEDELIVKRFSFPGKNTGWLGVGAHGNVWLITRTTAYWICDIQTEEIDKNDKKKIVAFAKRVMETEGSLDTAFKRATRAVKEKDFRGGYRVGLITAKKET